MLCDLVLYCQGWPRYVVSDIKKKNYCYNDTPFSYKQYRIIIIIFF